MTEQIQNNWVCFKENPLSQGDALERSNSEEIIGYSSEWIDEDFNPNGTRIGIIDMDDKFNCAVWCSTHDQYENVICEPPTHYCFLLARPN